MTEAVPLSAQQEAFLAWMQAGAEPREPVPVCVAVRVTDALEAGLLERALHLVTARHEALRTVFPVTGGRRRGVLLEVSPPEVVHLRAGGADLARAGELACRERERGFDLARGPLVRAAIIELGPRDRVLLLAVHHLVADGWSMDVLLRELAIIYSLLAAGDDPGLPAPMQCSEVVRLSRPLWPGHREAWSAALAGAPGGLGTFRGRRPADRFGPRLLPFGIPAQVAAAMRGVARANGATTFMVALTAWSAVLADRSGVSDLVVMSPVAGRTFPGSQTAVGCLFFNLLIRVDASGQPSFGELLRRVRSATIAAWARQDYPYGEFRDRFARAPALSYDGSRVPLHFPGLESEPFPLPPQLARRGDDLDVPLLALRDDQAHAICAELMFNAEGIDETAAAGLADDFLARLPGSGSRGDAA